MAIAQATHPGADSAKTVYHYGVDSFSVALGHVGARSRSHRRHSGTCVSVQTAIHWLYTEV